MLPAVDALLAATDIALALTNTEFAVEKLFGTGTSLFPPARRSEIDLFYDFLDDGLSRKWLSDSDSGGRRAERAGRHRGRSRHDATRRTDEQLGLAAGDISLTNCDGALARDKRMGALGGEDAPDAVLDLVVVDLFAAAGDRNGSGRRDGAAAAAAAARGVGECEHHREHGEDEGEDEEKGSGRDGAVVVVSVVSFALALAITAVAVTVAFMMG